MSTRRISRPTHGVTLVELIVALAIIAIAAAGLMAALRSTRSNTDPLIEKQMAALAEGLMEEVLMKPISSSAVRGSTRGSYQSLDDFKVYTHQSVAFADSVAVTDASGNAMPALAGYTVGVRVDSQALGAIPASDAFKVTVTAWHGPQDSISLTAWRTRP